MPKPATYQLNANGPERPGVTQRAKDFIDRLPVDKSWVVTVAPYVKKRSSKQRASLFAVAYGTIMDAMGLRGAKDKEDLHRFWCEEYFGVIEATGVSPRRPLRTTTTNEAGEREEISTLQALDMYAFIQQRAAENGIDCPDPDPFWHAHRSDP
jgi:hypothetical protein